MEDFSTGVRALLQDIQSNYGQEECREPHLPYSRPMSNSYQHRAVRLFDPRQTPASTYGQHALYAAQASRSLEPYSYAPQAVHDISGSDAYDRALLARPEPQGNSTPKRISLPGHTAPARYAETTTVEQRLPLARQLVPSPHEFKAQIARYAHTPPARRHVSSSPTNVLQSSPSVAVNQRRNIQPLRQPLPNVPSNTKFASSNTLTSLPRGKALPKKGIKGARVTQELPGNPSFSLSSPHGPQIQLAIESDLALPMVQGVQLVSVNELPDRLRSIFHHPFFNAIQSKCFSTVYKSNENLVVSAPTGGGKTAILELAICRLLSGFRNDQCKIVYMAPTKSLCSERQRDWQAKFSALDLQCAELTGDTEHGQLRSVQSASIVITTPEKWDSMTRKWKDHAKLVQMVKLFLIDEVHILKETRGATLEAVVSRMKSVGSNVRFVALSATVPNSEDIGIWLGKDPTNQHLPAPRERFGEAFRPVKLQKYVVGLPSKGNEFAFESACNPQLPSIIAKYSQRKPIMVFCITRKSAMDTAKLLARVWATKGPRERYWEGPRQTLVVQDVELQNTLTSGVAYHHAGLDGSDRHTVETGFLQGQINVICCTSTLAVGVNLPCHMVIIKNTVSYQDDGVKEYADLEIMQMLGRAGRPQFDTTAVAVIMTKQDKVKKYEKLVSGEELLESCLHLNLIDHLNAEIGLGIIYDLCTAKRWLCGTFLYVRLGKNPGHYTLDGDMVDQNLENRIERICKRDIALLEETQLITSSDGKLKATAFGDAMARYCIEFATMQKIMQLEPRAKISDILSTIVQAEEFQGIRLRANEKKLYREINRANGIKFPIKVDLALHAHKRSLVIQAELGGVEYPTDEQYAKHKRQFNQDKAFIFDSIHRLIHCVIDCQIHLQDAVAVRHALELARSFGARVWDNSPYQMKQIPQIGLVAIRKLAVGGINSIEVLEATEPHRIEMLLSKNPPFGNKLLANLRDFPKLRVSIKMMGKELKKGCAATIRIKAECGFMNDKIPMFYHGKPIQVCLLTERSDGFLVDFRRINAKQLNRNPDIMFSAELLSHTQYITCHVMCNGIAGTVRHAELKPDLPAYLFPSPAKGVQQQPPPRTQPNRKLFTGLVREQRNDAMHTSPLTLQDDEFDDNLNDQDIVDAVGGIEFADIETFDPKSKQRRIAPRSKQANSEKTAWNPERLGNGKWACNHKCKEKTACRHLCCREGIDKAPKAPKGAFVSTASLVDTFTVSTKSELSKPLPTTKSSIISKPSGNGHAIEMVDLASKRDPEEYATNAPREFKKLHELHEKVTNGEFTLVLPRKKPTFEFKTGNLSRISFYDNAAAAVESSDMPSTDYEDDWMDNLPSPSALLNKQVKRGEESPPHENPTQYGSSWQDGLPFPSADLHENDAAIENHADTDSLEAFDLSQFNDDQADLEDALVGFSDSVAIHEDSQAYGVAGITTLQSNEVIEDEDITRDSYAPTIPTWSTNHATASEKSHSSSKLFLSTDSPEKPIEPPRKRKAAVALETKDVTLPAPIPKKPKTDDEINRALQPSSSAENKAAPSAPVIKPGQPAWVYEFDPAFIAEWQDFVDFV
ncbi:hypothetical protein N7G274_006430 [Stereocaulon virgatum]|uniref:DNA 3'-5' helicase n=1 Tax=Stereocaulon virgatum TaxID=373712 RepID=A0ABR4A4Y8_9LECA